MSPLAEDSPVRRSSILGPADLLAGFLAALAFGFLAFRPDLPGRQDLIPRTPVVMLGFLAAAFLVGGGLWRLRGRTSGIAAVCGRIIGYALVAVAIGMAGTRIAIRQHDRDSPDVWPPSVEATSAVQVDAMAPADRARWGLWLALASWSAARPLPGPVSIPDEWPFPADVMLGWRMSEGGGAIVFARAADGTTCRAGTWAATDDWPATDPAPACDARQDASGVEFALPRRDRWHVADDGPSDTTDVESWPQYRRDAAHTIAGRRDTTATTGWSQALHTPIRASASTVGDLVLIGGHATGVLVAVDARTGALRWRARAPNWIHQDPVSDGSTVVVGFGDKERSFLGTAPSGVAAYSLATGALRWVAFDESSMMASPVIHDSTVISISAAGMLRARDLATGVLRAERRLPGGAIMGPAALRGDTLVVALEVDGACALRATDLETLWCRRFPGLRRMGHASPALLRDEVVISGVATAVTPTLREFVRLPPMMLLRQVRSYLFPAYWDVNFPGQVFLGLDLATGNTRWRSRFHPWARDVDGHMAGTAVLTDSLGVIVLPVSDEVIAFDPVTGAERWTQPAHQARGPVLVHEGSVIVAGRDGVVTVWGLDDGAERCRFRRPEGFDRAGPTPAGPLAIFARVDGVIEAIPFKELQQCDGPWIVSTGDMGA